MQNTQGYYRQPAIWGNDLFFISDDDLWKVPVSGGIPVRLTANYGYVSRPVVSPDGKLIAFSATDDAPMDIYLISSNGGSARRLTWFGSCIVCAWKDNETLYYLRYSQQPNYVPSLYYMNINDMQPHEVNYGHVMQISFGSPGTIICRNNSDLARWKRYKGGTRGQFWIDRKDSGVFKPFLTMGANLSNPLWIGKRIYYITDQDGIGNLYSCKVDGTDIQKHTHNSEYYVRGTATDGKNIVYHSGADLFVYSIETGRSQKIDIDFLSPMIQRKRKFVSASSYLQGYSLSDDGGQMLINARGKAYHMGNWEGNVTQYGKKHGVRYRLLTWLNDKKQFVAVSDENNVEHLVLFNKDMGNETALELAFDTGRVLNIKANPVKDTIAFSNHRNELVITNYVEKQHTLIAQNKFGLMNDFSWSPDGRWLAYSISKNPKLMNICIYDTETKESHEVTEPILVDYNPVFDPNGEYLIFVSVRHFNPMIDSVQFELSFQQPTKLYMIALRKDVGSPFLPPVKGLNLEDTQKKEKEADKEEGKEKDKKEEVKPVLIDFDGIAQRIIEIPIAEGNYFGLHAIGKKLYYADYPLESFKYYEKEEQESPYPLKEYDLETREETVCVPAVEGFSFNQSGTAAIIEIKKRLRVIDVKKGFKDLPAEDKESRKTGWIDLSRIKVDVIPMNEWQQMFNEAWRLQKFYFWVDDMSKIDWERVRNRYYPLVERVGTRLEFSDLVWEMQGELGTSHCYEFGGDYRMPIRYNCGFLGADFSYDEVQQAYRITHIVEGDPWLKQARSPLTLPGVNIVEGMLLHAINGECLSYDNPPEKVLCNQVGTEVQLTVSEADGSNLRKINVLTTDNEFYARHRDWVEKNRKYVHEKTNGKIGYVHIPNMWVWGYSEFHRYFLSEVCYDGLIVDVRYNGGGSVSQLILEKLARKRIGFDITRWFGYNSYPQDAVAGPIVALTNEFAGSDGDIFSHSFKLMKLGKLIGKRTWGGVIGIWPRNALVDATLTTQPEFSYWFKDVGWGVENYGTDPDIDVDITPQDFIKGLDPQLDKSIEVALKDLELNPPMRPDFGNKSNLQLP